MTVRRRVTLTRPELRALDNAAEHFEKTLGAIVDPDVRRQLTRAKAKVAAALSEIAGEST